MERLSDIPRRRLIRSLVVFLLVLAILGVGYYFAPWRSRSEPRPDYQAIFPQIQKGARQEYVIERMGEPDRKLPAAQMPESTYWNDQPLPETEAAEAHLVMVYGTPDSGEPRYLIACDERGRVVGKRRMP